jgi:hypothetical protein
MVKIAPEAPPPGVLIVTLIAPEAAIRLAGTAAVSSVAL